MRSDGWLTKKIIKESLYLQDISYMRLLIREGRSDEEVLATLRRKMFVNSEGMRAYIRHEKTRALMVKLSSGIHWVCLLSVIKSWITEKEALIRWKESDHSEMIEKKTRELKNMLIDPEYKKMKFDCANGEALPDRVMDMLEKAAEELLASIEEAQRTVSRTDKEDADPIRSGKKGKQVTDYPGRQLVEQNILQGTVSV